MGWRAGPESERREESVQQHPISRLGSNPVLFSSSMSTVLLLDLPVSSAQTPNGRNMESGADTEFMEERC